MLYFFQISFVFFLITNLCVHIGFSRFSYFIRYSLALVGVFPIGIECQISQVLSPIGNLIGSKSLIETRVVVLLFSKCIQSILLHSCQKFSTTNMVNAFEHILNV